MGTLLFYNYNKIIAHFINLNTYFIVLHILYLTNYKMKIHCLYFLLKNTIYYKRINMYN